MFDRVFDGTFVLSCHLCEKNGGGKFVRASVDQIWIPEVRDLRQASTKYPAFKELIEDYLVGGFWRQRGRPVCAEHNLALLGTKQIATKPFAPEYWDAARIVGQAEELFKKFGNVSAASARLMAEMDRCLEYNQLEEAVRSAKAAIALLHSCEMKGHSFEDEEVTSSNDEGE